jgi:hypothetical protein
MRVIISTRLKLGNHEACIVENRKKVGNYKGKRGLGRSSCRWESTIKFILKTG